MEGKTQVATEWGINSHRHQQKDNEDLWRNRPSIDIILGRIILHQINHSTIYLDTIIPSGCPQISNHLNPNQLYYKWSTFVSHCTGFITIKHWGGAVSLSYKEKLIFPLLGHKIPVFLEKYLQYPLLESHFRQIGVMVLVKYISTNFDGNLALWYTS